jgi:outer membrane immunogenic protein
LIFGSNLALQPLGPHGSSIADVAELLHLAEFEGRNASNHCFNETPAANRIAEVAVEGIMSRVSLTLLVATGLGVASGSIALSADMRVSKAPIAAPPMSWTGIYIGDNSGCGSSPQHTNSFSVADGGDAFVGQTNTDGGGCFSGLQIGYNYQFASNWVAGIEGDIDWSWMKGQALLSEDLGNESTHYEHKLSSFGTFRGRLGWTSMWGSTPTLTYITGGWAWGRNRVSAVTELGDPLPLATSDVQTHNGWTIGGGLEFAFTRNLSIKAEYLFLDLGSKTYNVFMDGPPPFDTGSVAQPITNFTLKVHAFRLGTNYRF